MIRRLSHARASVAYQDVGRDSMKIRLILAALVAVLLACALLGRAQAQTPVTIFGTAVPHNPDITSDAAAVTLGVKFRSTQAGTIAGIRFYRAHRASSAGYTVKLFSSSGSRLAQATTTTDTCAIPCWEQVNFASPISIAANTVYVAAYYTANGNYADDETTNGGLTNAVTNGPLTAPASSSVGGNGVYTYSTGFPNQTWQDSNYYVDISFTATAPTLHMVFNPTAPTIPSTAPPGTVVASVMVTWSNGDPFTGSYKFEPPNGNDNGTFAFSGANVVVGSGLSADGGTTQNITVCASQQTPACP